MSRPALPANRDNVILTECGNAAASGCEHNPRHFDKYVFNVPIPLY